MKGYRDLAKELEALADEYKRVWRIADVEKHETGRVSRSTEDILICIEAQLEAIVA